MNSDTIISMEAEELGSSDAQLVNSATTFFWKLGSWVFPDAQLVDLLDLSVGTD